VATITRFEHLDCWIVARQLCSLLGKIIDSKKFNGNYGLINQIERSSGSIMDNIAEGFDRGSRKEFINFLSYSKASCAEVRSQLYRALDRNYLDNDQFNKLFDLSLRVTYMVQKLIRYLQKTTFEGTRKI
jgi:four helix bundle protein